MSDLNVLREIIAENFTDEWKPLGLGILDELAAARAAITAADDFFRLRRTSCDGNEIHGAALAYYALREAYDKVRGKGET